MKLWYVLVILALVLPPMAVAGPNAGGVLLLHQNPALVYTADHDYCDESGLTACEQALVNAPADPESTVVFFAFAAFPTEASPRLKALAFGIEYDAERLVLVDRGACAGFELADNGWPASGTGTALVMDSVATGALTPVYWFAAAAYSVGDTTSFALVPHPTHGREMADDAIPAVIDTVAAYGRLGFGTTGYAPCPDSAEPGGPDGPDHPTEVDESLLVWQLQVVADSVVITENHFSGRTMTFPRGVVEVRRRSVTMTEWPDHVAPNIRVQVVPLEVGDDGLFPEGSSASLPDSGIAQERLAHVGDRTLILSSAPNTDKLQQHDGLEYRLLGVTPDSVRGWEESPTNRLIVVHTPSSTLFFAEDGLRPIGTYPKRTSTLSFARDGNLMATIAFAPFRRSALVLFDSHANVIYESPVLSSELNQLFMAPSGTAVVVNQARPSGTQVLAFNVETQQFRVLDGVPDGFRYYSADGNTMLVIESGFGLAHTYDSSDPLSPDPIATYDAGSIIYSGAVSDDGSRIALQIIEGNDPTLKRVVVMDRYLQNPLTLLAGTNAEGLAFDGQYVFVGLQDHPLPTTVRFATTTVIYLFSLGR